MKKQITLALAILGAFVAIGWSVYTSGLQKPGAVGNNGVHSPFPDPPPEIRETMEKLSREGPPRMPEGDLSDPEVQKKMRMQFEEKIPAGQQAEFRKFGEKMREQMTRMQSAMSPEEMSRFRGKMMSRFQNNGGRGPFGGPRRNGGGDGGTKPTQPTGGDGN